MRIEMNKKRIYGTIGACVVSLVALACGGNGASNNDQGVSVTFLGLFNSTSLSINNNAGAGAGGITPGQQGCGQLPAVFLGGSIQLGTAAPEPSTTVSDASSSGVDEAGSFISVVGVQNNLYGQVFRADRVFLDYYIPGATAQPPSTNVPVALLAGPAEAAAQTNIGGANGNNNTNPGQNPGLRKPGFTSLPPSMYNICNRALAQITVIPAAIREWLNFNRDSLPEAPFAMEVTIRVTGLSSSGDRIDTNDGTFPFQVLPETYVVPTDGEPTAVPGSTPTSTPPTPISTPTIVPTTSAALGSDASGVEQLEAAFDLQRSSEAQD
jgi:hypothetical protein